MLTAGTLKVAAYNLNDVEGSWEEFSATAPRSEEICENEDMLNAILSSSDVYMQPTQDMNSKDASWKWAILGDSVEKALAHYLSM
jgi:hypothetical protein